MKTYKKYTIFQSYKVVALKLSLPCPFECKNSKGRGTHNFWATTLKLWKNEYFLRVFKSYYYHFFIFLLDSDLEKTLLSQTSIAWGVLDQVKPANPWYTCRVFFGVSVVFPNQMRCVLQYKKAWVVRVGQWVQLHPSILKEV